MPDPCADLLAKAYRYLATHTAAWPAAHLQAVLTTPDARADVQAIETAALAGDARACASACRAYWQKLLAQAPKETP